MVGSVSRQTDATSDPRERDFCVCWSPNRELPLCHRDRGPRSSVTRAMRVTGSSQPSNENPAPVFGQRSIERHAASVWSYRTDGLLSPVPVPRSTHWEVTACLGSVWHRQPVCRVPHSTIWVAPSRQVLAPWEGPSPGTTLIGWSEPLPRSAASQPPRIASVWIRCVRGRLQLEAGFVRRSPLSQDDLPALLLLDLPAGPSPPRPC